MKVFIYKKLRIVFDQRIECPKGTAFDLTYVLSWYLSDPQEKISQQQNIALTQKITHHESPILSLSHIDSHLLSTPKVIY